MTDEGTLATSAQTLLAIGENAGANQILEANTNIWIKMAESDLFAQAGFDFVTNIALVDANLKQLLAAMASHRAAFYAIQQNQNTWQLATTQSKLNVIDNIWTEGIKQLPTLLEQSGITN